MRILFVTATRAEWGKLEPLVLAARKEHEVHVAVTGMHLLREYGTTACEVEAAFNLEPWRVWRIPNGVGGQLGLVLSDTTRLFGFLFEAVRPHLVVVHGDRSEALGAACATILGGYRLAHVEGGEISGGLDESMRHAVTKLAHVHFVANARAADVVAQLGERADSIHIIGSPEVDMMLGPLPTLDEVREHYEIPWREYGVLLLHAVSTEEHRAGPMAHEVCCGLQAIGRLPWVVVQPNADPGHDAIMAELRRLPATFRLLPSLRPKAWYRLLRDATLLVGNSSAGVREAPVYGVPVVNVGSRQACRTEHPQVEPSRDAVGRAVRAILDDPPLREPLLAFGDGHAAERFARVLAGGFDHLPLQKTMVTRCAS